MSPGARPGLCNIRYRSIAASDSAHATVVALDGDCSAVAAAVNARALNADAARSNRDRRRRDISRAATTRRSAVSEPILGTNVGWTRKIAAAAGAAAAAHGGFRRAADADDADCERGKPVENSL